MHNPLATIKCNSSNKFSCSHVRSTPFKSYRIVCSKLKLGPNLQSRLPNYDSCFEKSETSLKAGTMSVEYTDTISFFVCNFTIAFSFEMGL